MSKKGGKSDFKDRSRSTYKAAVVVCSDSISAGHKEDKAGKAIISKLEECGVDIGDYIIIPDEVEEIRDKVRGYEKEGYSMTIITGGTGLSARDVSPEALETLINRRIPGIEEAIRSYGQQRTPYAMLSRSVVGTVNNMLVLALPGSTKGAQESMEAIFPHVLHVFGILKGARHKEDERK